MAQSRFPSKPTAANQWITVATTPPPADHANPISQVHQDALAANFAAQLTNVELPTANPAIGAPDAAVELAYQLGMATHLNADGSTQAGPPRSAK